MARRASFFAVLSFFLLVQLAIAASGLVRGRLLDPDCKPVAEVALELRNDITGFKAETRSGPDGTFQFWNVPFNPYELHVEAKGFVTVHQSVDVRSSAPRDVTVTLALASRTESLTVTAEETGAELETDSSTSQGAHSQGEFVVDGQTISDQTGITFSNSIDPGIAQSIEVIYGNVPAEYGAGPTSCPAKPRSMRVPTRVSRGSSSSLPRTIRR